MNNTYQQYATAKQRQPFHVRFFYCGVGILLVGLVSAALIYISAVDNEVPGPSREIENEKIWEFSIEGIGGKAAVYAVMLNRWLAGLWHGRPLAYTVAVLTIAIALVCFSVARIAFVRLRREPDKDREG